MGYSSADIYGAHAADVPVPKFKLGQSGLRPDVAHALVRDELFLDGNARQNLSTFCQTWLDPEVHELMDLSIDKNMIDKDEYPATAEIEKPLRQHPGRPLEFAGGGQHDRLLDHRIERGLHAGRSGAQVEVAAADGGGREADRQAQYRHRPGPGLLAQVRPLFRRGAARDPAGEGPPRHDAGGGASSVCDENTIGVVPTFGVTFTCQYEPVAEIAAALDKLQAETGLDIPIHVDAASGGFIAPFIEPGLVWDFRIPRVKSINASGHKYGLAPLGVGWVVWRDKAELPEELIFNVNYLGGNMPTFALNFSRPAGQIIAQYYLFLRLGRDGYRRIQQNGYDTAQHIGREVCKLGPFELFFDGSSKKGIPAISWVIKDGANPGYSLFDLSDRLRVRGWQVAAYTMPPNIQEIVVMRVLVRHGFSRDMADMLLEDTKRGIDYLLKHRPATPQTAAEGTTFTHDGTRGQTGACDRGRQARSEPRDRGRIALA